MRGESRNREPILRSQHQLVVDDDIAMQTLDDAHDRVRRPQADLVTAVADAERHRVGDRDRATVASEHRAQHECAIHVRPLDVEVLGGAKTPVPGFGIQ